MTEGNDTTIEVSNIMCFVLYTQISKQSVLKPASPGITSSEFLEHSPMRYHRILSSNFTNCGTSYFMNMFSLLILDYHKPSLKWQVTCYWTPVVACHLNATALLSRTESISST